MKDKIKYLRFSIGDKIRVKNTIPAYDNMGDVTPDIIGTIKAFAPKVRMVKGLGHDNHEYFAYCEFNKTVISNTRKYQLRAGVNICNLQKVKVSTLKILRIYDNGGRTADRYTVYFNYVERIQGDGNRLYSCLGMSASPFHPQGFCQHSSGQLGRHNGKRIELKDLPLDCQKAVYQDLFPFQVRPLMKLKRPRSCWLKNFSNRVYPVTAYDTFRVNGEEVNDILLVAKTGPDDDIDYQLVYPDEVKIIS